jgi:hypothetical protein
MKFYQEHSHSAWLGLIAPFKVEKKIGNFLAVGTLEPPIEIYHALFATFNRGFLTLLTLLLTFFHS